MNKLIPFLEKLFRTMEVQGRGGTRDTYWSACCSVFAFNGSRSLTLRELFTKDFLHRYQAYLQGRGCCYNTISSYMRVLRAIRNKAGRLGLIPMEADLFDNLWTGSDPTRKRALSGDALSRLRVLDLSAFPHLEVSRKLFMLLFLLQGMSFVDLVHLHKSDLKGNYITYHRRKSGSLVTVKVLPPARALLGLFLSRDKDSPYLLSILEEDTLYRSLLRRFNRHLNTLGDMLGLEESLTSYVARHTWATSAYHIGVPTAVIGQAMGHRTESVTSTYLASFNTETVDDANRMVWESMFGNKTKNTKNVSFLGRERHDSVANVKRTFRKRNPPAF